MMTNLSLTKIPSLYLITCCIYYGIRVELIVQDESDCLKCF